MKKIYQLFEKMDERKVQFCFQNQAAKFYNLSVEDIYGKQHSFHSSSLGDIEDALIVMWGSLLDCSKPTVIHMSGLSDFPAPPKR